METDELFTLMMDALDGELSESGWAELESHLRARPDRAREWEAMQAIDALFRSTPLLSPAGDFAQRTLARIPNPRQRLWVGVMVYVLVLASGAIPLAAVAWILVQIGPALVQPAFLRGLWQGGGEILSLVQVTLGALFKGVGGFVGEEPAVLGWFLVMTGVVVMWVGVYNRLVLHGRAPETLE